MIIVNGPSWSIFLHRGPCLIPLKCFDMPYRDLPLTVRDMHQTVGERGDGTFTSKLFFLDADSLYCIAL